jgi:ABC-type phosphate transport system permease subunit
MLSTLKWFNVGLRGLMEVGIIIALGYWGYKVGESASAKILLAVGAPLIVFGFWGLVDFAKQVRSLSLCDRFKNW